MHCFIYCPRKKPFFFFYFPLSVCFLLFLQSESFAVVRAVFRRFETRARFSARTVFFLAVVVWLHLEKVRKQSYNLLYTEYQINCVLPFFFTRLCNLSRIMEVLMSSDVIGAIAGGCIAALIVLFFLVLVLRTLANRPEKAPGKASDLPQIDKDAAVRHLREAVRIPTVSMVEDYADNVQPFIDYRNWLEKTYPLLHAAAERTIIEGYSLIFKIKGTDSSLKGGCYLSHIDVVPAPADGWEHPPFEGVLTDDGYIYGRGSQDMKSHMIALLEAVEYHLAHGRKFARDLYLCFGHDEEPGNSTSGAANIVRHLKAQGVEMEFVIDEGGTVLDGKLLGIPHTVALVGACEKGNGDLELVVRKSGGHASNPKPPTAVGLLSEVVAKVESHPMKTRWTPMTKETFKALSPYCKGAFKFVLTNRDVFAPLLKFVFTKVAPMTNALVRTTFAPTMLWGSDARNVIPKERAQT